ncbi:MAG TPA: rod shape-determining protein MreC [Acidimicrobiia bacterium]|nr:rod shape-determining protein MreC [Acidimicrobiia bacterium]
MRPPLVSVLVASAVTLILVGRAGGPLASAEGGLRSVARAAFVPVESAGDAAFRPLEGAVANLGRNGDLAEVTAALARERERAESEAARADAMTIEASRLAALLALDGPAGAEGFAARVVSVGAGPGAPLVLDRGTVDGVRAGMPVVAAGGLVGRVLEAGPHQSTVLPLTDTSSAVGVRAGEPAASGVGQGLGASRLRLDLLDPNAALQAGDLVVTSGLRHSRFPAGLAVGRVAGERGRFFVQPFAPPDRLELVKVLRWEPGA